MEEGYLMDISCHAKSKTTGEQCKNPRVPGATVCRIHGGAAPQVKAAAARRVLEELVGPAMAVLADILRDDDAVNRDKLVAARDILDRNGYKAPTQIEGYLTLDMIEREIARYEADLLP
jgi:hypothetical protein